MGDLSSHFSRFEIACPCGCGFDSMDAETLRIADEVRMLTGHSITPSSGARCIAHNRAVGGAKKSQHTFARAMDLPANDPSAVFRYLCDKYPGQYGFGLYDSFVHIDTRTDGPARWNKQNNTDQRGG